ncbi:hypothetical protein [Streptomyces vietnamensis]|uniref:Uncharacterized protein n=1 Tax=Streptomyces vietnamensis TaxID=362257 RepID=A0A0B5I3P7_9ACTN|nr:hypothetical protein [Streptomyces vietnamensis]AJF65087.1 hypothetical protein SVTN_12330 [Streptomyces vietnamensis]
MDSRHGFLLLLGAVQMTLIFTLASLAVPLPRIGAEFRLDRAELILLSAAYGLAFAGLLLLGGDAVSLAAAAVLFTVLATVTSRTR